MMILRTIGLATLMTLAPVGGAARAGSDARVPVGPGSDFTVLSKTTTNDPLTFRSDGPVEIRFSELHIDPGGTTAALARPGLVVIGVDEGDATLALAGGGSGCRTRVVGGGSGAVQPGETVNAISNGGTLPVTLHLTTLTPAGTMAPAAAATGCPAPAERGVAATVLHTSVIDTPLNAGRSGASDVYVGIVRADPGRSAGPWHVHDAPVFVGVSESRLTIKIGHGGGHCEVLQIPAGGGTMEMAGMVHEASNRTGTPLAFYILGFAPSLQPILRPAPMPDECRNA